MICPERQPVHCGIVCVIFFLFVLRFNNEMLFMIEFAF